MEQPFRPPTGNFLSSVAGQLAPCRFVVLLLFLLVQAGVGDGEEGGAGSLLRSSGGDGAGRTWARWVGWG